MDLFLPYIACLILALALYAALRPSPLSLRMTMIVIGVTAAGWLIGLVTGSLTAFADVSQGVFFFIFSLCGVASSIRLVTHDRPVYSALYFVLVVLSTAGLFLLLEAEFMAFALVIVYAGAILITYMFVLMLANQAVDSDQPHTQALYDRIPREPAAAVGVGFLLLCLISGTVIGGTSSLPTQGVQQSQWSTLEHLSKQFESSVMELDASFAWPPVDSPSGNKIRHDGIEAFIVSSDGTTLVLPTSLLPTNTQQVGWSLVNDFPVSLELAGVILLMAMFGAAILARRAIELGEQEKRNVLLGNNRDANPLDDSGDQS
jgi:NADH-quinone oxidoreductase subunit J